MVKRSLLRITFIKRHDPYLKLKIFDVALNRERRLFKGGAYSKINILDMNYFLSEDKINKSTIYSQNINVFHQDQAADKIHKFFFDIRLK